MYWVIHTLVLGFLSYVAYKQIKSSFRPIIYWSALALKLAAGICVGLIFHYYYKAGDSLILFEQANELADLPFSGHWKALIADGSYATNNHPRDVFFIKILSVFSEVTGNSYWITSLYLSFISFLASWFFVISVGKLFPSNSVITAIAFLFVPTIVFWSSGILKDTLSSAALIFSVTLLLNVVYLKKSSIVQLIIALISLLILFNLKHYLFIAYILFTGLFIDFHLLKVLPDKIKWVIAIAIMIAAISATQYVHPYLKWERIPKTIVEINNAILGNTAPLDHELIVIEEPTWEAIGLATPKALFTGLFRPSIFDSTISFGLVHRLENFALLILSVFSFLLCFKEKRKVDLALMVSALACICLLATMLALTTPNFGTLVRYRNAFMPFLILITSVLPYDYLTSKR